MKPLTPFVLTLLLCACTHDPEKAPPSGGALTITIPEKDTTPDTINPNTVLTLLLGEKDNVYCYLGIPGSDIEILNLKSPDFTARLLKHKNLPNRCPDGTFSDEAKKLKCVFPIFVVKPTEHASAVSLTFVMDFFKSEKFNRWAYADIHEDDVKLLKSKGLK